MGEYRSDRHLPSFRWYACVLYPWEDPRHKRVFNLITKNHMQFPSFLYIEHEPEINVNRKIDNNMNMHEISDSEAEAMFKDKENDNFAEDLDPKLSICKRHMHMCFKFPKAYTYNTALRTFLSIDNKTGDDMLLLNKIEPIHYTEKYFTYMLHMDERSRASGKTLYSYKSLHGDSSIITKLVVNNTNFVQFAYMEFAKFVSMNMNIDSSFQFTQCLSYLARADPVKFELLDFIYRHNRSLVQDTLKDISIHKKYKIDFDTVELSEKYLNSDTTQLLNNY